MGIAVAVATVEKAKLKLWDYLGFEDGVFDSWGDGDPYDGPLSGYSKRELKVIQSTNVKLARMLSRSKHDFRVFFLLEEDIENEFDDYRESGPVPFSNVASILKSMGLAVPRNSSRSVNVILTGLGQAFTDKGNLPPTPWIVVHWIAHGVLKTSHNSAKDYEPMDWMFYGVLCHVRDTRGEHGRRPGVHAPRLQVPVGPEKAAARHVRGHPRRHDGVHHERQAADRKAPAKLGGKEIGVDEHEAGYYMEDLAAGLTDKFDERLDQAKGMWYVV